MELIQVSDKDLMEKYRGMAAQCWCSTDTEHLVMNPELAEQFAKMLFDNSQNGDYWKAQARVATDKVSKQAEKITRLESKVKELEALNESLQGMPELTNELAQIGEIARQEADTYNMIEAFKVGYEAIRKEVEGE